MTDSQANYAGESGLIAACLNRDRSAQHQLYVKWSEKVYGLMIRMAGRENAEDLTQQVFLRVFQSLDKFSGRSQFSTWLYRVAANEALQFLRKQSRRTTVSLAAEPRDHRASESRRMDDRECLEAALAQLDPDLRAIFLLREREQLSYHELALALDIAEGTVASRLNRARRTLQQLLGELM